MKRETLVDIVRIIALECKLDYKSYWKIYNDAVLGETFVKLKRKPDTKPIMGNWTILEYSPGKSVCGFYKLKLDYITFHSNIGHCTVVRDKNDFLTESDVDGMVASNYYKLGEKSTFETEECEKLRLEKEARKQANREKREMINILANER